MGRVLTRLLSEVVVPAARINIDLKSRSSEKRRGYTDEEAKIILRAARAAEEAHKRWVPWVCAYTGARIAEICQLRPEDIKKIDGIWCIAFAAEAGSLKNVNSERAVPVHSALEDEGCQSAWGPDADWRGKLLICLRWRGHSGTLIHTFHALLSSPVTLTPFSQRSASRRSRRRSGNLQRTRPRATGNETF
jgi:hypothetical protein